MYKVGPYPVINIINAVLTPNNWPYKLDKWGYFALLGGPHSPIYKWMRGPPCKTNLSSHGSFGSSVGLRMERQNSDPDEADKDKDAHREATSGWKTPESKATCQEYIACFIDHMLQCMEYLPTFTIYLWQIQVNIPYREHMGSDKRQ